MSECQHMTYNYYRPHPKDGGRKCFHGCVSVHTGGKGGGLQVPQYLVPCPFPDSNSRGGRYTNLWFRVHSQGSHVLTGGTPVPGTGYPSVWSQVHSQPLIPCPFWEVTQSQLGGTPVPGYSQLELGNSLARTGVSHGYD